VDKEKKRELRRAFRDAERLAFIDRMPLLPAIARQLFDRLEEQLGLEGCRHDFRLTTRCCQDYVIDEACVMAWLNAEGAGCDCEVLANVEDRLTDAMEALQ